MGTKWTRKQKTHELDHCVVYFGVFQGNVPIQNEMKQIIKLLLRMGICTFHDSCNLGISGVVEWSPHKSKMPNLQQVFSWLSFPQINSVKIEFGTSELQPPKQNLEGVGRRVSWRLAMSLVSLTCMGAVLLLLEFLNCMNREMVCFVGKFKVWTTNDHTPHFSQFVPISKHE